MAVTLTTDKPVQKKAFDNSPNWFNKGELVSGVALDFDGVNDYLDIGDTGADINTVIIWIKPTSTTEKIIDFDGGTHVLEIVAGTVTATGFTDPTIYVDGYSDNTEVQADVWVMIAVTTQTAFDANNMDIGRVSATYGEFEGANCIVYSDELSSDQVVQVWQDPSRPIATGLDSSSLKGWWPMCEDNDNIGIAFDYSGNGLHATISGATYSNAIGAPLLQTAIGCNYPMYFDTTDDSIDLDSSVTFTGAFSIASWFYLQGSSSRVFLGDGSRRFRFSSDTTTRLYTTSGKTSHSVPNALGFHHIVLTRDSNNKVRVFLDGVESSTGTTTLGGSFIYSRIGRRVTTNYFAGIMFDLATWENNLLPNEIVSLYNSGLYTDPRTAFGNYFKTADLKGYYINSGNNDHHWRDLVNANNGTVTGTPELLVINKGITSGKDGLNFPILNDKKLRLRGSENVKVISNESLDITSDITLGAWVKIDASGSQMAVIGKNLAYSLEIGSTPNVIMSIYQTTNKFHTSTATVTVGEWTHIVGTYTSGTMAIYINGVLDSSTSSYTGSIDSNTNEIQIGSNGALTYFTGEIDEEIVYNRVLSINEIIAAYLAGLPNHTN